MYSRARSSGVAKNMAFIKMEQHQSNAVHRMIKLASIGQMTQRKQIVGRGVYDDSRKNVKPNYEMSSRCV